MRRILPIITIIILLAFSCSEDNNPTATYCIRAEFASADMCTGFLIIDIKNFVPIGRPLDYNGGHWNNAIKVVGNVPIDNEMYFRVRKFDPEKDQHLFEPVICLAIYAPAPVPQYVVESISIDGCP